MPSHFPRLLYALEFLLAILSVTELWSQIGGQGHLDLIPWYTKLALTLGLTISIVCATVSAVGHERAWNAKTAVCLTLALMFAGGMAAATYYAHIHENYAHIHENDDLDNQDENVTTVYLPGPRSAA